MNGVIMGASLLTVDETIGCGMREAKCTTNVDGTADDCTVHSAMSILQSETFSILLAHQHHSIFAVGSLLPTTTGPLAAFGVCTSPKRNVISRALQSQNKEINSAARSMY
jgi:hypothetical protein